jgi:hypothetical protein
VVFTVVSNGKASDADTKLGELQSQGGHTPCGAGASTSEEVQATEAEAEEDSVMDEQGNAAKAKRRGSRRAGAGVPAPASISEKVIPSDDCFVHPGPLGRIIGRVAAALVGARSRRRRPVDRAAVVTRLLSGMPTKTSSRDAASWWSHRPGREAAPDAGSGKRGRPGRLFRATRPPGQNQERVVAARGPAGTSGRCDDSLFSGWCAPDFPGDRPAGKECDAAEIARAVAPCCVERCSRSRPPRAAQAPSRTDVIRTE